MLFDPYGRELTPVPKKPLTDMVGAVQIRDQWSTYPSVRLTPDRLASIFREADAGLMLRQVELFEEMEEKDPVLASLFQTRKLSVQGLEYEIVAASDSPEDKNIADHVRANFADLDLEDAILDLLDAIAKGSAFVEINWALDGNLAWAQGLEWIHQKRFTYFQLSSSWWDPIIKLPFLLTKDEPVMGVEVPPFKLIYHRYKARSGFAQRAGLMRTVGYYYLFKNYTIKDWVIFLEKFGQPLRLGKFSPGAGDDDKKILREAIQNLGTDAGAMISDTTMLEILEAKTTTASSDLYDKAATFFNKEYSKAILGQTASIEGTPGRLGNEKAQEEVRTDIIEADAKALAKTLRSQLIWPMVGFNFGWDKPLPKFIFQVKESEDLAALSTAHKNLVEMGMPIPVAFVQKKYGIPAAIEGEAILQAPAAPTPGFRNPGLQGKKKVLIPVGSRLVPTSD